MTLMLRERAEIDFVDLKGTTINDFYMDNLILKDEDPAALRVVRILDLVAQLPGFERLREGRPLSFQWAFYLAMLMDSLNEGKFTSAWARDLLTPFLSSSRRWQARNFTIGKHANRSRITSDSADCCQARVRIPLKLSASDILSF